LTHVRPWYKFISRCEKQENFVTRDRLDLTTCNIPRAIFFLAWPAVLQMGVDTAMRLIDAFWVGRLGAADMAAVTSSIFILWTLMALAQMLATGVTAMVARFTGARDRDFAEYVVRQAIRFGLIFSVAAGTAGFVLSPKFMQLLGVGADVAPLGTGYLRISFLSSPVIFTFFIFGSALQGAGDTRTPLKILLLTLATNAVLDPILIMGLGPVPRLGTNGAAIATALSHLLGAVVYFGLLNSDRLALRVRFLSREILDFSILRRLLRIGIPSTIDFILFSVVYVVLTRVTAVFGTEAVAALGIGNRIESVSYMTSFGFSIAASTLVGQNLGAGRPDRSEKAGWMTSGIIAVFTAVVTAAFLLLPTHIVRIFIKDPLVVQIGADYLRIVSISQIFMGVEIVIAGGFVGAGDTVPPTLVSGLTSLARIPLAYYLGVRYGLGTDAIWWIISLTGVARGVALPIWFKAGTWKKRRV
jgi:putative MATE family efflux protein